jgi:hypothetical protein
MLVVQPLCCCVVVGVVVVGVVVVVVVVAVVVVVEDVTVTVCITVEITVDMFVTVEVTVRVTVEQILVIDVGEPPAPVEMPPTKSTARAAANMNLRVMSSLLSGEADVSRTACSANHCRHWVSAGGLATRGADPLAC